MFSDSDPKLTPELVAQYGAYLEHRKQGLKQLVKASKELQEARKHLFENLSSDPQDTESIEELRRVHDAHKNAASGLQEIFDEVIVKIHRIKDHLPETDVFEPENDLTGELLDCFGDMQLYIDDFNDYLEEEKKYLKNPRDTERLAGLVLHANNHEQQHARLHERLEEERGATAELQQNQPGRIAKIKQQLRRLPHKHPKKTTVIGGGAATVATAYAIDPIMNAVSGLPGLLEMAIGLALAILFIGGLISLGSGVVATIKDFFENPHLTSDS